MKHPSPEVTQIILDNITDGVFTVDANRLITYFNRAAEQITGFASSEVLGRHCWEVFRAGICNQHCSLQQTLESGQPVVNREIVITNSEDRRIPISITTTLLTDDRNRVFGAVETFRDLSEVQQLRRELAGRHSLGEIIGKNDEILRLFEVLESVSEADTPVLLEGEKGTGKEMIAKTIHDMSFRKNGPFIGVSCRALPEALLETELFGYTSHSKSKSQHDKPGRVALAAGGTLYLDELDAVSPKLQKRIVKVMRDSVFEPLGSDRPERADVRILAATSGRSVEDTENDVLRGDLFERLSAVRLRIPPLRERKEDIPLLIDHLIKKHARLTGKTVESLSSDALPLLMAYDYPGNASELERIIEYALVICPGEQIQVEHLPENIYQKPTRQPKVSINDRLPSVDPLMTVERSFIYKTLMKNAWNRKATAAEMGIHPTTLWRKMKRLNMEMPVKPRRNKTK